MIEESVEREGECLIEALAPGDYHLTLIDFQQKQVFKSTIIIYLTT